MGFQAATHTEVARVGRDGGTETLEQKAKAMANMSRNIASLFGEDVIPGGREAMSVQVSTLSPLGFGGRGCLGTRGRPQLMCPE